VGALRRAENRARDALEGNPPPFTTSGHISAAELVETILVTDGLDTRPAAGPSGQ
jgi:hypothetical protein